MPDPAEPLILWNPDMPYSDSDKIKRHATVDPLIILGGVILTFIAGFINTTSLMYFHVPVSHMSGVVSKLSIDLGGRDYADFLNLMYIFLGFFLGAITSGYLIGVRNLKPSKEYSLALMLEAASLLAALAMFRSDLSFGLSVVAFACGLQNAMASNYLGLIIRTTHVTGIVTDLGVLIGQSLKHRIVRMWKILFLSGLLGGFFLGGFSALVVFRYLSFYSLLIPAAMCLATAIVFFRLRIRNREGTEDPASRAAAGSGTLKSDR